MMAAYPRSGCIIDPGSMAGRGRLTSSRRCSHRAWRSMTAWARAEARHVAERMAALTPPPAAITSVLDVETVLQSHSRPRPRPGRGRYAALGIVDAEGQIDRLHHQRSRCRRAGADRRPTAGRGLRSLIIPGGSPVRHPRHRPTIRVGQASCRPPGHAQLHRRAGRRSGRAGRQPLPRPIAGRTTVRREADCVAGPRRSPVTRAHSPSRMLTVHHRISRWPSGPRERERIGRELHDGIIQSIAMASRWASRMPPTMPSTIRSSLRGSTQPRDRRALHLTIFHRDLLRNLHTYLWTGQCLELRCPGWAIVGAWPQRRAKRQRVARSTRSSTSASTISLIL